MRRSQPLDMSNKKLAKYLKEETEEEKIAGRTVVKTEIVDKMFDIKLSFWDKLRIPFVRLGVRFSAFRRTVTNVWSWRKLFRDYYRWDVRAFLPLFVKHLELYIDLEQKHGTAIPECREYKITTAQEARDILKRLIAEEYDSRYTKPVKEKWGKFQYEKTTYADGSAGYKHLAPEGYSADMNAAYEKARVDESADLKRLGELIEKNMLDWWD